MWTGILQILELVLNHRVHLFLVFYLLSWGIFAYRFLSARKNKLNQSDPVDTSISAIVLSFRDRPKYLYKSLKSIAKQKHRFNEVLLAMDHDDYEINKDIAWAYSEAFNFKIVYDKHGNKRTAFEAMLAFLKLNGKELEVGETSRFNVVVWSVKPSTRLDEIVTWIANHTRKS